MTVSGPNIPESGAASRQLSPKVAVLGLVSMLTALSSAMIYGLLPVFMVRVLGIGIASVGVIEGLAEAANSLVKILSGAASDRLGRRKPLVVFGYALSTAVKTVFPVAGSAAEVLAARVIDRLGKGIRDAPRDAFVADLTASDIRGSGFGLRIAVAIAGYALGPLIAVALMRSSGGDFRLVFWIALIPAFLAILLLVVAVEELPNHHGDVERSPLVRRADMAALPPAFWWVIAIASLLSLARFSQAFLVLKVHDTGVDAAYVPIILVVMHLVYSASAYPFGKLADRMDRRSQLAIGAAVMIAADVVLAGAQTYWLTALGAALWGLQLGVTQGLLGAAVADVAPERLRGTAFGIFDMAIGIGTFVASAGAGALWAAAGPAWAFGASGCIGAAAALMLLLRPLPKPA